jgi:hypothetical protein
MIRLRAEDVRRALFGCRFQDQVGFLDGYVQSLAVLRALLAESEELFTCPVPHGVIAVRPQRQDHDQDSLIIGEVVADQSLEHVTFSRSNVSHIANHGLHVLLLS